MVKKIAALAGAGALLLSMAVPIFANGNFAIIKGNDATATANTGGNGQGNSVIAGDDIGSWFGGGTTNVSGNNSVSTGDAEAKAKLSVWANVGCDGCGEGFAVVKWNDADAYANTGLNEQGNYVYANDDIKGGTTNVSGDNSMTTGYAKAKAKVFVVVNSSWGGI